MSGIGLLLVEAVSAIDAAGTLQTQRLSNGQYATSPSDTPANTPYLPRIAPGGVGAISRQMFSGGRTSGASEVGYGAVSFVNPDGALDAWANYGFAGRECVIKIGEIGQSFSTLSVAIKATMAQVAMTRDTGTISLKDRLYELDKQHLTATYAGNNSLPNGLEGADDLKGKLKPLLLGKAYYFLPPCCNTSRLIYQLSYALINSIEAVYQGGVTLAAGALKTLAQFQAGVTTLNFTVVAATDIATTASNHGYATGASVTVVSGTTLPAPLLNTATYFVRVLSANTFTFHPTAADAVANTNIVNITTTGTGTHNVSDNRTAVGAYDWCFDAAGSYIRLGSSPGAFEITVDATQGAAAGNRTTAQILKALALARGIVSGDINAGDVTALDTANAAVVGDWWMDDRTTRAAMDKFAGSIGAYYFFDRIGGLRMGRFAPGSGTPVLTINQVNGRDLDRVYNADGQPAYRVTINHSRYGHVQTSGLAGSVAEARKGQIAQEVRSVTEQDVTVLNQHLGATELVIDTLLTSEADASTEATRLLAMRKVLRGVYTVTVFLDTATVLALDLNAVVTLQWDRFGLDAGVLARLIGGDFDFANRQATLTLWV